MGKAVWGMVKRIILWKIKDDQNKQANLNLLREGLLSLSTKIGDIVSVEVGLNFSSADYDIIFIVAFADPFQLKQFQSHPEYLKIFQHAQTISTNMIFCDYMAETSTTVATGAPNVPPMAPGPKALIGTNTGRLPNINNINNLGNTNSLPNNLQQNNMGGNGMFGSLPKNNDSLNNTKPFSPITNKNALPFAGGQNNDFANPNNNSNNNNQYNGFDSMNDNKNGVNFTVSENVNQIRFANGNKDNMNGTDSTWKCSKCGKTNSSFINMCSCGRKKPVDNMPRGMQGGNMPNNSPMQGGNNMGLNNGMQLNNNNQGNTQNSMLLNSSLLPKVPSMPKSNMPNSNGSWVCPSCGKSNNEFMKVCVCGHRKVDRNAPNGGPGNFNTGPTPMGFNGPNMNMPKNPSMGMNNIKSPNNNEFFNSFGGNNGQNNFNNINKPNNPMGGPGGMNKPNVPMGGPGGMNKPNGPMNGPMGGPGGPGGMNKPNVPMGGPGGPGGMNPNMSRMQMGATGSLVPPNRPNGPGGPGGPGNLPPDSWKCPRCGKVLGNFVGQCVCGQRKPTRPTGPSNGPGSNNSHMRFN